MLLYKKSNLVLSKIKVVSAMTKIRLSAFVCEQVSTTQKCCVLYVLIIQTYVALAAKNIGGNIQIVNYRKMADVKSTDIERNMIVTVLWVYHLSKPIMG